MPIKVLIAEDEPAAARYLKALIEQEGPGCEVVAVASHGEEALQLVALHRPDLVFTDVKMPLLDGIGLLTRLRDGFPAIVTVIVSGYQEFDYARQALLLGVSDYLLKPVNPALLQRLLADLAAKIGATKDKESVGSVGALVGGFPPLGPVPDRFRAALVRWGGPPTHPAPTGGLTSGTRPQPGFWVYPGRDSHEFLVLADAGVVLQDAFEQLVRGLERPLRLQTSTLLLTDRPVAAAEVADTVRNLGPMLDRLLVLGRAKIHWGFVEEVPVATLDPMWTQKLRWALQESAYNKLETLVRTLVAEWDRDSLPVRQAAYLLRQSLLLAQQASAGENAFRDWEFLLEDSLGKIDSFEELADLAWSLVTGVAGLGPAATGATDAPEAHQRIRRFLQTHYPEPLSIPVVCERFQLSQTYLSKLFRRYEGCTFHEYLTRIRLDAAEQLLNDSPGLPLKTVASCVGYQDPFHFSRAFKAAKGRSPSQKEPSN